jgi:hypothetical protein
MVGHILRKDLKLLWRMVLGVALINLIHRAILSGVGPFGSGGVSPLVVLSGILGTVGLLATGILIVMVVQQDPLPGLTQDWLVRPIRRRDLLLSKVLFVALMVQFPIFLVEVGQCLAAGFPILPSLAAPFSRSVWMFLAMDLPVLAFATLTRSLAQAAGAGIAVVVGFAIFTQGAILYTNALFNRIWVTDAAQIAWGLAGVAAVLALQYYRRKTTGARWVYGGAVLVCLFVQFLPWQPAFAIERRLSPQPAVADAVQIAFDPAFGRFHRPAGQPAPVSARASRATNDPYVWAPLRVSGVSEGQMLTNDGAVGRLIGPGATMIDLGRSGMPIPWDLRGPFHYLIFIPKDIYNRLKDVPVGLEIDYSLTLRQANPAQAIPAAGGDQWIEDVGRCAVRTSAAGAQVELGCLTPGNPPCVTLSLESNGASQGATQGSGCASDYAPYFGRVNGDSISRFFREFPFPGSQLAGSELKDARVFVKAYRLVAHFTRQVVIPNIRLSDWRPE